MNFHTYFSSVDTPVQACVAGSGGFGRSFIASCLRTPLLHCRAAVDIDAETVVATMRAVGIAADNIRICRDSESALQAWEDGAFIATDNLAHLSGLPLDILVEATGSPEAGARHAEIAIDANWHVAMVSKEVDSVVGPGLAHKARQRGRVVTPVDGDQPSLLIGLITWAQVLGLEIVAAGKASEYDFVFDPSKNTMHSNGTTLPLEGFGALWNLDPGNAPATVAARAQACAALPQRAVPDFCEMQVVANNTGIEPSHPDFHVPILRIAEVPEVLRLKEEGGLLDRPGTLELFHCLRKPDELSFAGGVFVVVRCDDPVTWELLAGKGHVVSADQRTALIYLPRHLLGAEAATSVLEAGGLGISSGAQAPKPVVELVGRATTRLAAGTRLTMGGHHHTIDNVAPALLPAGALQGDAPAPFYLIANHELKHDVEAGAYIRLDYIILDETSPLLRLRRDQDEVFFPVNATLSSHSS